MRDTWGSWSWAHRGAVIALFSGVGALIGAATYGPASLPTGGAVGCAGVLVVLAWAWTGRWIIRVALAAAAVTVLAVVGAWAEVIAEGSSLAGGAGAGVLAAGFIAVALWWVARPVMFRLWLTVCVSGALVGAALLALFPGWGLNALRVGLVLCGVGAVAVHRFAQNHRPQRYEPGKSTTADAASGRGST